jgi:hypothetical protein
MNAFPYGCMKSQASIADAGSSPATSTTTGVHGFDGMWMCDGQLVMVPAVSGSGESAVRCDGPNSQTPTTAFIGLRRQPDVPAARNGTQGRHHFNADRAPVSPIGDQARFSRGRRPVTPAGVTACSPALPAQAGFYSNVHAGHCLAQARERAGTIRPKGSE